MKRKLFTLLLASVALVAFQANAQTVLTSWWIFADTTGLAANTAGHDSFPKVKKGLANWFTFADENIKVHQAVGDEAAQKAAIYEEGAKAKFKLAQIIGSPSLFRIQTSDGTTTLSRTLDGETGNTFEIVRFDGDTARVAQVLSNDQVEGYLAWPASGADAAKPYSKDLVLLGVNNEGALSLKKFSEWGAHFKTIANDPWSSTQFEEKLQPGRLYLSKTYPFFQTYDAKGKTLITGAGEAINFGYESGANASTPFAWTYLDLKIDGGKLYEKDSVTAKVGLDSLLIWFREQSGSWTTLDTISDFKGNHNSTKNVAITERIYIIEKDGHVEYTVMLSDNSWTNGEPTPINVHTIKGTSLGSKYYYIKTPKDFEMGTRVPKALAANLGYTFESDPAIGRPENYLYLVDDSWRPIYISATPTCESEFYEYANREWIKKWEIAGVQQTILGDASKVLTLNDNNKNITIGTENAAKLVFEVTGDTLKNTTSKRNVELFTVRNQKGEYLTVLDSLNAEAPAKVTVTGLPLGWSSVLTGSDTLRQHFAIVYNKEKGKEDNIALLPAGSVKWKKGTARGGTVDTNKHIADTIWNACGDSLYTLKTAWILTNDNGKLVIADSSKTNPKDLLWLTIKVVAEKGAIDTTKYYTIHSEDGKNYYTQTEKVNGQLVVPNTAINAHWTVKSLAGDKWKFLPEVDSIYHQAVVQGELTKEYTLLKIKDDTYELILGQNPYKRDTIKIEEVTAISPFVNLDAFVGTSSRITFLESLYEDRNISYYTTDVTQNVSDTVYNPKGLSSSVRKVTKGDAASYSWVTVYKSNVRYLGKDSVITVPYYVFAYRNDKDEEYFLSVINDSRVQWTLLSKENRDELVAYDANYSAFPNFKFCLPILEEDKNEASEGSKFYLQTLDAEISKPYYFVKTSKESGLLDADSVTALLKDPKTYVNLQGIYSLLENYKNLTTFSSWITITEDVVGSEWLKVASVTADEKEKAGVITNVDNATAGTISIAPSKESPVNYGILTGIDNPDITLKLAFVDSAKIGYERIPIWYYNIIKDNVYLTDAVDSTKDEYTLKYSTGEGAAPAKFQYAFFGTKTENDTKYQQTFGLKLVDKTSKFVIVSQAYGQGKLRYVGAVRGRLVFVNKQEDALTFQWGQVEDNKYTGIGVVGAAGIYGVTGGVKVVNATGAVAIYSIDGRLIKSSDAVSPDQTIAVPAGIYIVKNGASVVKVLVK
jgi:hypothetical protein